MPQHVSRMCLIVGLSSFQFLTEEDFEKIRLRQLSQKLEPSKSRKRKAQEILEEDLADQVEDEK